LFRLPIGVVNHNAVELDRTAPHSELNGTKSPISDTDCNVVVIRIPVYMRRAQKFPPAMSPALSPALSIDDRRNQNQKQYCDSSK
jgi:hypothetical protein